MSRPSPQFLCSATRWRTTQDPPTLLQASDYLSLNQYTALSQKARNWNSAGSKWSVWRWRERNQNRLKKAILRKSPKKQTLTVSKQRERTFLKDFSTDVAMQLVRKVLTLLLLTLHRLAAPLLLDCLSYSICPVVLKFHLDLNTSRIWGLKGHGHQLDLYRTDLKFIQMELMWRVLRDAIPSSHLTTADAALFQA